MIGYELFTIDCKQLIGQMFLEKSKTKEEGREGSCYQQNIYQHQILNFKLFIKIIKMKNKSIKNTK